MKFDFATPTRVVFGAGTIRQAGGIARMQGTNAFVVTGRNGSRATPLLEALTLEGVQAAAYPIHGEPTLEAIRIGANDCRQAGCDVVIGFGGGSALDAAKAIAALATNPGDPMDYLEVIGKGQPLADSPLPFIAIPTTAGTGSEVTHNAVLGSPDHRVKVSLRSPLMRARVAIVDPALTLDLPPEVTASTGMDALTQCIEALVSCKATPLTDAFSLEGIQRAARSLAGAFRDGNNLAVRTDMAMASLCSGIALANAGLGAVHGFAGPIGGMFPAPHGAVCASLLPAVMEANLTALRARDFENPRLPRFQEIARLLTGRIDATPEDGIEWVSQLKESFGIPRLSAWNIYEADIPDIVTKAAAASSMKGNPLQLDKAELRTILMTAL
jgi:alcohol dehydrogenase class IV